MANKPTHKQAGKKNRLQSFFALDPVGDFAEPLTKTDTAIVQELISDPTSVPGKVLQKYGIKESPSKYFAQAKIQLYGRQLIARYDIQMATLTLDIMTELQAMASVNVVDLDQTPINKWTPEQKKAVTKITRKRRIKTHADGSEEVLEEEMIETKKLEALQKLIKIYGLGPDHPHIRRFTATVNAPDPTQAETEDKKNEKKKQTIELLPGQVLEF